MTINDVAGVAADFCELMAKVADAGYGNDWPKYLGEVNGIWPPGYKKPD